MTDTGATLVRIIASRQGITNVHALPRILTVQFDSSQPAKSRQLLEPRRDVEQHLYVCGRHRTRNDRQAQAMASDLED